MTIKNQKGAAAVEFAFVLPLLLLLLFGIVEFSILFYNKAMITNASREGARAGIVFAETRLTQTEIKTIVDNYIVTHLINFNPSQSPDTIITQTGTASGDSLTVTVTYQYDFLVFPNLAQLVGGVFANIQTLEAVTVMRYE